MAPAKFRENMSIKALQKEANVSKTHIYRLWREPVGKYVKFIVAISFGKGVICAKSYSKWTENFFGSSSLRILRRWSVMLANNRDFRSKMAIPHKILNSRNRL